MYPQCTVSLRNVILTFMYVFICFMYVPSISSTCNLQRNIPYVFASSDLLINVILNISVRIK